MLIKKAIEFMRRENELDRQTAFLLLDVGVETLLKTFLLLPDSVTGVEMGFQKRKEATESSFHDLIEAIRLVAKDRIEGIDLDQVKYFHTIRNKLYHLGDGVVPTTQNTERYADLVVELLRRLLDVDLLSFLYHERQLKELTDKRRELVEKQLWPLQKKLHTLCKQIESTLIERLYEIAKGSFVKTMSDYLDEMSKEAGQWKVGIRRLFAEGVFILDNENKPVGCLDAQPIVDDGCLYDYLLDNSPIGPVPRDFRNFIKYCDLDWNEETLAEMLTADDLAEMLLVITNLMEDFPNPIALEDYRAIRGIINWDYEKYISEEEFEGRLNELVERGNKMLQKMLPAP